MVLLCWFVLCGFVILVVYVVYLFGVWCCFIDLLIVWVVICLLCGLSVYLLFAVAVCVFTVVLVK